MASYVAYIQLERKDGDAEKQKSGNWRTGETEKPRNGTRQQVSLYFHKSDNEVGTKDFQLIMLCEMGVRKSRRDQVTILIMLVSYYLNFV